MRLGPRFSRLSPLLAAATLALCFSSTARADAPVTSAALSLAPNCAGVDPVTNQIYLMSSPSRLLAIVDGPTNHVVTTLPLPIDPGMLGVDPSGKAGVDRGLCRPS